MLSKQKQLMHLVFSLRQFHQVSDSDHSFSLAADGGGQWRSTALHGLTETGMSTQQKPAGPRLLIALHRLCSDFWAFIP